MKIVAIIQARLGSQRLPGKVLKPLMDKTVLAHVIGRVSQSQKIDQIIVATSELPQDDLIELEALACDVTVFRGDEQDVLSRYYGAALREKADVVVRITSDCPLIDSEVIDRVIGDFQSNEVDFASNCIERSYPRGLDTEVVTFKALQAAHENAYTPEHREHVTQYIYQNPQKFQLLSIVNKEAKSSHRWTLDTPEDWLLIQEIYKHIYVPGQYFNWLEALKLVEAFPEISLLNENVEQKR